MSFIRSRKHCAASAAAALSVGLLVGTTAKAQSSSVTHTHTPNSALSASKTAAATLPEVQVRERLQAPYRAEESTNPKLTAPLRDTPQTVAVIRREIIQEQGATTLQEALRNTPGITLLLGEGGNSSAKDNIFMRGFDSSGSVFVDGVRNGGSEARDTFNTEQIEVIKGASASEFGRGAPSGSINMATKVPFARDEASARLSLGTASTKRATLDLNRKLSDTSAVRLNVMAQDSGVAGRDRVKNKGFGLAPSVAFGLGTPTRVFADVQFVRKDNVPDGGVPTVGLPGYYNAALANAGITARAVNPENFYGYASDFSKTESQAATVRVEHDISPTTTVRNVTRITRTVFDEVLTSPSAVVADGATRTNPGVARTDPATWTAGRGRHARWQDNSTFTNQTNLSTQLNTGSVKHTISAGLELIAERQIGKGRSGAGTTTPANLWSPNPHDALTGYALAFNGARTKGQTRTVALYAFDTMEFTPQWQLTGGLRAERYATTYESLSAPNNLGVQTFTRTKGSGTLVNGKLGVVFKPVEEGSLYAGISTSQQPPGGNNFALSTQATNINNPNMDPSRAINLELGSKWEFFDRRLMLTGAVFRTTVKNDLARTVDGQVQQYGQKRVSGLELGVVGQITPAWNISAGLARMNTRVVEGTATQTGAHLNWSPKVSFTSWTTYRLGNGLTVGGGARFVDSVTRSVSNRAQAATTNMLNTPKYWVYDAYVAWDINPSASVQLNIYNLADKHYIANLNNNGGRYNPGAGRSAVLSANFKF